MKKMILLSMVGVLLIGVNAFAQGDLQVNGQVGVGTVVNPNSKLIVQGDYREIILGSLDTTATSGVKRAIFGRARGTNATPSSANFYGLNARSEWLGSANHTGSFRGGNYNFYGAPTATATLNEAMGVYVDVSLQSVNGSTVTDMYGFYMNNVENFDNITNLYGLYLPAITQGANNYGIVLDGDGAGSDIVFGPNQEASIYAISGEIWVKDGASNVTQISPHDPETGEWIYYSKNIKTGIVKRVNMEKLVSAVEKLTGETFMIETVIDEK